MTMHHAVTINESPEVKDATGAPRSALRSTYLTVRALFKRGASYLPGDLIELDPQTASSFLAAGDIKEMQ